MYIWTVMTVPQPNFSMSFDEEPRRKSPTSTFFGLNPVMVLENPVKSSEAGVGAAAAEM